MHSKLLFPSSYNSKPMTLVHMLRKLCCSSPSACTSTSPIQNEARLVRLILFGGDIHPSRRRECTADPLLWHRESRGLERAHHRFRALKTTFEITNFSQFRHHNSQFFVLIKVQLCFCFTLSGVFVVCKNQNTTWFIVFYFRAAP